MGGKERLLRLNNSLGVRKDLKVSLEELPQPGQPRALLLQPECRLPAPATFPSPSSEVRHVIVRRQPVVTDDPAENPLQWLHQFRTPM